MTTHTIKPGESIQAAINGAAVGDELIIADGVYSGAVNVSKPLTLRAENPGKAVIDGGYGPKLRKADGWLPPGTPYVPLVKVTASDVTLEGLSIRNSPGRGLQVMASNVTVSGCAVDFAYNGVLWVGGASKTAKITGVRIEWSNFTRGSMKAFDPTRGYGGSPMGVDGCAIIMNAVGTRILNCAFAYGAGEGLTPYRGAVDTLIDGCLMHSHLHDNLYVNAGGAGLTVRDCIMFDAINAAAQLEACGLNVYGNCTLADEEPEWTSGPGFVMHDCIFAPSYSGRVFAIEGWNGTGKFPRPFALRGYTGYCTMAAGPRNNGTLFGSSTHLPHSGLIENLIITGAITAQAHGKGWTGVVVRNLLSADAPPTPLGAIGNKLATNAVLNDPTKEVNAPGFDLFSEDIPDPYATDFDPANYAPTANSQAWGMAASGPANGITPPVTRPDIGAAVDVVDPPPPDEPPAWAQPLTDLGAHLQSTEEIRAQLAEMKATFVALIDALDSQLTEVDVAYDELAVALNGEGGIPGAE